MNLHFQNLKDLTMDQIFFVRKKEIIYFLRLQKQEFRKEERKKQSIFTL